MAKDKTDKGRGRAPETMATTRAAEPGGEFPKITATVTRLRASAVALADSDREAFRSRCSDERCSELGGRTRGENVASDAVRWAALVAGVLAERPHAVEEYGPKRFAWYLECLAGLLKELDLQRAAEARQARSEETLSKVEARALAARRVLLRKLKVLAGQHDADREALTGARGRTDSEDSVSKSLTALADLAEGWLSRTDEGARVLVRDAKLTPEQVAEARRCAALVTGHVSDEALERGVTSRDTPPVNRAEGRVLFEMQTVMGIFEEAHEDDRLVPRLVPGSGTRSALSRGTRSPAEPPEDPRPEEPQPAPSGDANPVAAKPRSAPQPKPGARVRRGR